MEASHKRVWDPGAILLAAGASRRLGQPKQLTMIGGEPLVARQARLLLAIDPACVIVVTGAHGEDVEAALESLPVTAVRNHDWRSGRAASLSRGIRAMPERARGALVLLCDQWKIDEQDLRQVMGVWSEDMLSAVVCAHGDTFGPPCVYPRALFQGLSRLKGEQCGKQVLKRWNGRRVTLDLPDARSDLDVAEDLARFRECS